MNQFEASLELCGRKPAINMTLALLFPSSPQPYNMPSCLSEVIGTEQRTRNMPEWLITEVHCIQNINLNTEDRTS